MLLPLTVTTKEKESPSSLITQTKHDHQYDNIDSMTHEDIVKLVGGKAASLMKLYHAKDLSSHVPNAFALTVDFFDAWIVSIKATPEWKQVQTQLAITTISSSSSSKSSSHEDTKALVDSCDKLKAIAKSLPLSDQQSQVLDWLRAEMKSWSLPDLAAVRSSAPEEDGASASFAGAFETRLGVTSNILEEAVRDCFASIFDYRVFSYHATTNSINDINNACDDANNEREIRFAAVVMEMVDSYVAGVAFSANPINSDLDEMVVDSSWGLGESVVDGTVDVDHYVWNKVSNEMVEKKIGKKTSQKRLDYGSGNGVMKKDISDEKVQSVSTLSESQLKEICDLICKVESMYGMPMDVEWAYTASENNDDAGGEDPKLSLKLLQARPITTLYQLDEHLITKPGDRRKLYYDFNIASDATTTSPFTHMDMELYSKLSSRLMGYPDINVYGDSPQKLMFNSSTRQYFNMSHLMKYMSPVSLSGMMQTLDHYLADILKSSDCDRKKYRSKKLPKEMTLRNAWFYLKKFPYKKLSSIAKKCKADPEGYKNEYINIVKEELDKLSHLRERGMGPSDGIWSFAQELTSSLDSSLDYEGANVMFNILPLAQELNKKRTTGKTQEERDEYDALSKGYVGDELMEINIAIYKLAQQLPASIWSEYSNDTLDQLANRIQSNIDGQLDDIPQAFLDEWKIFMQKFGWDGKDQLFVSSPRYRDRPDILLAMMKHNIGDHVQDPEIKLEEHAKHRREVMSLHEERAKKSWKPFSSSKVKKRNEHIEHLMWIRNAPKLHLTQAVGIIRESLLKIENEWVANGRLHTAGDIFHLSLGEVDKALKDDSLELKSLVEPRKAIYERALKNPICPVLVDSRCRILRPDAHKDTTSRVNEAGNLTLVGSAISPGVATGIVRIVENPTDPLEVGEVLVTFVTDPAWTPMFALASGVVLQIGGVLQHGALCAREYGIPAVSGIDILSSSLKTGMKVSVDGNTGVIEILDDGENSE